MHKNKSHYIGLITAAFFGAANSLHAGEADLKIPGLEQVSFDGLGGMSGLTLMYLGIVMCAIGAIFGLVQYWRTKNLPVHKSMSDVSHMIWETCKTYLLQQGKFLAGLWLLIAGCIFFYFKNLELKDFGDIAVILLASVLGILGSYGVAWFGIRINTMANSRTAFSALKGNPLKTLAIPLRSGMSVGLLLVCVELFFMICILVFVPRELVGPCFIGFAIGESLGASVLAHLRRHFHQNCGHRQRPDENCFQTARKMIQKIPASSPIAPATTRAIRSARRRTALKPTA